MFYCQVTGKLSESGEKPQRLVVESRPKQYKHWDREAEEEWFSSGSEIVREVNASAEGVAEWKSMTETQRSSFLKSL